MREITVSIFGDNFRKAGRAAVSSGEAYFRVAGLPGFPILITQFQYEAQENIQVVEAFKEFIHVYAFGRRHGTISIAGVSLNVGDNFASAQALKGVYENQMRAFKVAQSGQMTTISGPLGVLKGVATNLSFNIAGGADNIFNFQMGFIVVDSSSSGSGSGGGGGGGGGGSDSGGSATTSTSSGSLGSTSGSTDGGSGGDTGPVTLVPSSGGGGLTPSSGTESSGITTNGEGVWV